MPSPRCGKAPEFDIDRADPPFYTTAPTAAIKETREWLAAAGYPDGIKDVVCMIRDAASFKLWSVAIQAMLQETLNLESNLRMVQVSVHPV